VRIAKRFENQGVRMVGISTDEDPQDVVPEVARQYHIPYLILAYKSTPIGTSKIRSHFPIAIDSVPRTLLFDRAGRLASDYRGVVNERVLASDITRLLRETANHRER
jgi:peroxiredoxin